MPIGGEISKMHTDGFLQRLQRNTVIGALKQKEDIEAALAANLEIVFFLSGTIFQLEALVEAVEVVASRKGEQRPLIFSHIDLLQGIGRDAAGMRLLARRVGVDGILTTRSHLIGPARDEGLYSVQRLFLLDSEAIKTGVSVVRKSKPDAVEILPALVLPYILKRLPIDKLPPIIAGGLVKTEAELRSVLTTPVKAISTSQQKLWSLNGQLI